jgi:hypothetical protein
LRWYLNDLSLWSQFATVDDFQRAFVGLLALRTRSGLVRGSLFISAVIGMRPVVGELTLIEAVYKSTEPLFRQSILQWFTKQGPFLDEERQVIEEDYFSFQTHDVTDHGLGEAARRMLVGQAAGVFSFVGGKIDCTVDPLDVQQGLDEAPMGTVAVPNVWEVDRLEARTVAALAPPLSWGELVDQCRAKYQKLILSGDIVNILHGEPFSAYVCERTFALLDVLEEYMAARLPNGERSPRSHEIVQTHFTGDKAWFSDESDANKHYYRDEMTFPDPSDPTKSVFAPWHGKIKTPQYRIHMEWPVPPHVDRIKVFYIGPKITKD